MFELIMSASHAALGRQAIVSGASRVRAKVD